MFFLKRSFFPCFLRSYPHRSFKEALFFQCGYAVFFFFTYLIYLTVYFCYLRVKLFKTCFQSFYLIREFCMISESYMRFRVLAASDRNAVDISGTVDLSSGYLSIAGHTFYARDTFHRTVVKCGARDLSACNKRTVEKLAARDIPVIRRY